MSENRNQRRYGRILLLLLLGCLSSPQAVACTTPVFRYALERWPAYTYIVEIVGRGPGDPTEDQAFDFLQASEKKGANIRIRRNPLPVHDPETQPIGGTTIPEIRLYSPVEHRTGGLIWKAPLTLDNVKKLVDSPARRQIASYLAQGDAAVWILLTQGETEESKEIAQFLEKQLRQESQELKLPPAATDARGNALDIQVADSSVRFSLVTVHTEDPAEEVLVRILQKSEPDLFFYRSPVAFPVFGRGRAMYALVGKGIQAENIRAACASIIGWCSCTIKESHPGQDLLMTAPWDQMLGASSRITPEEAPAPSGLSGFFPKEKTKKGEAVTVSQTVVPPPATATAPASLLAPGREAMVQVVRDSPVETKPASQVVSAKIEPTSSPLIRNVALAALFGVLSVWVVSRFRGPQEP